MTLPNYALIAKSKPEKKKKTYIHTHTQKGKERNGKEKKSEIFRSRFPAPVYHHSFPEISLHFILQLIDKIETLYKAKISKHDP